MVVILDVEKHLQVDDPPIYEELDYSEAEPLQPPTFISPKKRHNRHRKLSRRARVWLRLGLRDCLLSELDLPALLCVVCKAKHFKHWKIERVVL